MSRLTPLRLLRPLRQFSRPLSTPVQDLLVAKTLQSNKISDELIRCSIFDDKGALVVHGEDFKRSEFMKKYHLAARDFRKVSRHQHGISHTTSINLDMVPSIVTRNDAILLNLLNIRALIKSDTVVIFDTYSSPGGSRLYEPHSHGQLLKQMTAKLGSNFEENPPYEILALETILEHVAANLTTEMKVHTTVLNNVLLGLEKSIDRVKLRYLLIESKKITQFLQKTTLIRDLLNDILNQEDDELNAFYLTASKLNQPRKGTNHEEVELIFESYYKTCDEIVQTVENLISQVKTSEEIISIVLDSNRNDLMLLGLRFTVGLLSMGVALYVAALYGMNLENFIEEKDGGFEGIAVVSFLLLGVFFMTSIKDLRRLQRITMTSIGDEAKRGK